MEEIVQEHLPEPHQVDLVVIDPPYGYDLADWDRPSKVDAWINVYIPDLIHDVLKLECLGKNPRFVFFAPLDSPLYKVCCMNSSSLTL